MTKRRLILHPYLFAIYPVIWLYGNNVFQLDIGVTIFPLALLITFTFVLLRVADRMFGDQDRAAIGVSFFFLWMFSYSVVRSHLFINVVGLPIFRHRYLGVIWMLILVVSLLALGKKKLDAGVIGRYFGALGPFLILFALSNAGFHVWSREMNSADRNAVISTELLNKLKVVDPLPDIYYLILDDYTGQQGLSEQLHFDNGAFVTYLQNKGFFVAEKSHSNYSWTVFSLASSLNMEYLPIVPNDDRPGCDKIDFKVDYIQMIRRSKSKLALQSLGYSFVDLSIWSKTDFVDRTSFFYRFVLGDFNLSLLRMTVLDRPLVEGYLRGEVKRDDITKTFLTLRNLQASTRPRFVYAHFLVPHPPYAFDKDGNVPPLMSEVAQSDDEKKLYLDQLMYANKEMQKTIDAILSASKRTPIIIIQGDHGAYQLAESEIDNKKLRMSILNAYLVPDSCRIRLYDTISPVNTFRILMGYCSGEKYPLLPDRSYFTRADDPYALEDMTSLLSKQE